MNFFWLTVNTRHGCKGFGCALICAAFALVPLVGSHFAYMVLCPLPREGLATEGLASMPRRLSWERGNEA
jgi:hypothetical protein